MIMKESAAFIAVVVCIFCASSGFSAPWEQDLGTLGKITLESQSKPGFIAHFDRLLLTPGKAGAPAREVFNSKGQEIIRLEKTDLNQDGKSQILVTLDTGGSGGFIEYVLLVPSADSLTPMEVGETFKGGEARIEAFGKDGNKAIIISHFSDQENEESPPPRIESVFTLSDGKIKELNSAFGTSKP